MNSIGLQKISFQPSVELEIPSSKSISNRLLVLSFLNKEWSIENLSTSEDTILMKCLLEQIQKQENFVFNCKNAGTVFRFLTALMAVIPGEYILTGEDRMLQRPIAPLVESLKNLGVKIDYLEQEGYPPLRIRGEHLVSLETAIDVDQSSQFLSSLLLISPKIKGKVNIELKGSSIVSQPYILMTLNLLKSVGINYIQQGQFLLKKESRENVAHHFFVETDWSSLSYIYAWVALSENSKVYIPYLFANSLQGDSVIAEIFKEFGVYTTFTSKGAWIQKKEVFTIQNFEMDFTNCPDLALTFGVLCSCLQKPFVLKGLSSLQYKESSRLEALRNELVKCGVFTENKVEGVLRSLSFTNMSENICIDTYKDHRVAMAFSLMWIRYPNMIIKDYTVVKKSFPNYWECLELLGISTKK